MFISFKPRISCWKHDYPCVKPHFFQNQDFWHRSDTVLTSITGSWRNKRFLKKKLNLGLWGAELIVLGWWHLVMVLTWETAFRELSWANSKVSFRIVGNASLVIPSGWSAANAFRLKCRNWIMWYVPASLLSSDSESSDSKFHTFP